MPNEMLAALRKRRMEGMVKEPVEAVEAEAAPEGDMAEYWQRLEDMDAKIDQILGLLQPEAKPEEALEAEEAV